MIVIRAGIQHDLDWNALHHFHVVSSGVFGGQQAETSSAGSGNAVYFAVIGSAVGVDFDGDPLANLHLPQLGFFEVRRDPNVVEIDDLHQFLAGSDVLPDFHGPIADDAVHWGDDFCVLQVQRSLIEIRFFALGFGQGGGSPGAGNLHLLGRGIGIAELACA